MKYLTRQRLQKIKKYLEEYNYRVDIDNLSEFYKSKYLYSVFNDTEFPSIYYLPSNYSIVYTYGHITLCLRGINLVVFKIFEDKFMNYGDMNPFSGNVKSITHSYKEIEL